MENVRLGRNGPRVSVIGIGGWQIGSDKWQGFTRDESIRVFRRALDLGVTLIDTAESYQGAEEIVAESLQGRSREDVIICSKVWRTHLKYDDVLKSAESSLRRLK